MNDHESALINSAHDAYFALFHLDEPKALRILDGFSALYADAAEHIERDEEDLFNDLFSATTAPRSREELRLQFRLDIELSLIHI